LVTIDERLERLVGRHEALTESVEMLLAETREMRESISDLRTASAQDGENIRALARIAENS
jgi:hypothetical protein